jgi:putative membrane protein
MTVSSGNDPRIYFAAERTLLAWLRTGLAVVGLGFIVARFGLFLRALRAAEHVEMRPIVSALIGVAFVLLGTLMIAAACWQHAQFCRTLPADQKPEHYSIRMTQFIALIVLLVCTALAAYLLLSTSW